MATKTAKVKAIIKPEPGVTITQSIEFEYDDQVSSTHTIDFEYIPASEGGPVMRPKNPPK